MSICSVCKKNYSDADCVFANKKGRKKPVITCRECNRKRCKNQYEKRRQYYVDLAKERSVRNRLECRKYVLEHYMTHACIDCGENDYRVLQFDHVNDKRDDVGRLVGSGYPLTTIIKEIEKCVVRCANCHHRKTAKEQNWFKAMDSNVK